MSLRLLVDEDTQASILVERLKRAGHDVITINDLQAAGIPDDRVLAIARERNRVLMTQNCRDFEALHRADPNHLGILTIHHGNRFDSRMSYRSIVKAIENIEEAKVPLKNTLINLNAWQY